MRVLLACLLLLLTGCAAPDGPATDTGDAADGPTDEADSESNRDAARPWIPDPPRIHVQTDTTRTPWVFTATIDNPTGAPIWLAQRSCEVGAGVVIGNDTHGAASSTQDPRVACGWGPGLELAENATHRFEWAWNGTLYGAHGYVPAPAGVYTVDVWTSWAEDDGYPQATHPHDARIKAVWPGASVK